MTYQTWYLAQSEQEKDTVSLTIPHSWYASPDMQQIRVTSSKIIEFQWLKSQGSGYQIYSLYSPTGWTLPHLVNEIQSLLCGIYDRRGPGKRGTNNQIGSIMDISFDSISGFVFISPLFHDRK